MQAFTDLVGTAAVPALSINIDELTELTPALDTAQATHDTAEQASEAAPTVRNDLCLATCGAHCYGSSALGSPAAE